MIQNKFFLKPKTLVNVTKIVVKLPSDFVGYFITTYLVDLVVLAEHAGE